MVVFSRAQTISSAGGVNTSTTSRTDIRSNRGYAVRSIDVTGTPKKHDAASRSA